MVNKKSNCLEDNIVLFSQRMRLPFAHRSSYRDRRQQIFSGGEPEGPFRCGFKGPLGHAGRVQARTTFTSEENKKSVGTRPDQWWRVWKDLDFLYLDFVLSGRWHTMAAMYTGALSPSAFHYWRQQQKFLLKLLFFFFFCLVFPFFHSFAIFFFLFTGFLFMAVSL
jgi:hypothetical protein